nr:FAD-dependent oxidoreductase [Maliibacterium massiliense]
MTRNVDVAIIGGGPAGLAAAIAAVEAGAARVLVVERDRALGGILQQCIHNGFGLHYFGEELTGPEYAQRFVDMLWQHNIDVMTDTMVLEITPQKRIYAVGPAYGVVEIQAAAVVLAMGCRERTRGALNIPGTRPAGIYSAGCVQRLLNMEGWMPGSRVVILGSGDIGLIMARRLTWEGAQVAMVCELMPYSGGLTRNIVQCLEDNGIPLKLSHTVTQVHGKERLEGVTVAQVDAQGRPMPETAQYVPCDTLLLSVGLVPENELSQQLVLDMDPVTGGAVVDQYRQCSVPGVFACGNVLHVHDLVDFVSREAEIAGMHAAAYARGEALPAAARAIEAGAGVRYTVPQRVSGAPQGKLEVFFRVRAPMRQVTITARSADAVLYSRKKAVVAPGEMEHIAFEAGKMDAPIVLSVEEMRA